MYAGVGTTPSAFISGITGQDGSFLAELLLAKGYDVYGLVRRRSLPNLENIAQIVDRVHLLDGDLMDQSSLNAAVRQADPDEVYNLAAQSFVGTSFVQPVLTGEITGLGVVRMLEAMRACAPDARFYQASSSEMLGHVDREPQDETTPFRPCSPYGFAKLYGYWAAVNYRESYGLHVANGILYNHESERRGPDFLTRKVAIGVARIAAGLQDVLRLGNLEARRDWGYAPDYAELIWRILQHPEPEDFVGATGEAHTVREFVEVAFDIVGIGDWKRHVVADERHLRPVDLPNLRGDASKARRLLGWEPKVRFHELVEIMVQAELRRLEERHGRLKFA